MKKEKQLLLDEITNQMEGTTSFLITQYTGLTANKTNDFRRQMMKIGGNFEVVKKRVFLKALSTRGLSLDIAALPGHVGLVFAGKDAIETTKAVMKFSDENEKPFKFLGALLEGILIDSKDVERIAKLPSKDQMRAQLLGLFEAPMAQTLSVIEALLTSVPHCLENKTEASAGA